MSVEQVAQYLNILVAVVLVTRLFWLKLASKYAVFTSLITFSVVWSLIVALVPWRAKQRLPKHIRLRLERKPFVVRCPPSSAKCQSRTRILRTRRR